MKLASLLVSDYMSENPITIEPDEPLTRALVDLMREAKEVRG